MKAIQFLEKYGRLVKKADELKRGDICGEAGVHTECDVRLYFIENVILKPSPPNLGPPFGSFVRFNPTHVGLVVNGDIKRHYIHVPMPGESYKFSWAEVDEQDDEFQADYRFPLYLIEDEGYKKFGSLIKDVEMPTCSALYQTTNGEEGVYRFVNNVKDDIRQLREIYDRIRKEAMKP